MSRKDFTSVGEAFPNINLKELRWTEKQRQFIELSLDHQTKIMLCSSPAGTGKTILALYCSLNLLLEGKVDKILYIRNPIEAARSIGYLKGKLDEKLEPFILPAIDNLNKLLDEHSLKILEKNKALESIPLGFVKGRTFDRCAIIMDEAEDLDTQEFRLIMTRLGRGSKMFLIGDDVQSNVRNGGFKDVINLFDNSRARHKGIHTFEFTEEDIMRNDLIQYIVGEFRRDRIV